MRALLWASVSHPGIGILASSICFGTSLRSWAAIFYALAIAVIIEKLIHTTYTVTPDGKLVLSFTRFPRRRNSDERHHSVERASSMAEWFAVMRLRAGIWRGQVCSAFLSREEEFIRLLEERRG